MKWQVKYALEYIGDGSRLNGRQVQDELISISAPGQPNVLAAISAAEEIDLTTASKYREEYPQMQFLCGYRKTCVWHGSAIESLEGVSIGWGNLGTLTSAAFDGEAHRAAHKTYKFADRLLRQFGPVQQVIREYDRIHSITLQTGARLRIGMIADYEPTADAVRSLWDKFGPINFIWNINPNSSPTDDAIEAGKELGCGVGQWEQLKEYIKTAR